MAVSDKQQRTNHGSRMPRFGRGRNSKNDRAPRVVNQRNPCSLKIQNSTVKMATWNVRSMYESGKLKNIEQEMMRLKIDILGISDTRWIDSGELRTTRGRLYYSGNTDGNDSQHLYGVAINVSEKVAKTVTGFIPISERIILLQMMTTHGRLNIIQIYAPTADKEEVEIEKFYDDLQKTLHNTKSRDITIVMGDFNAKVGEGRCETIVGPYGLGVRNERGDRLIEFCLEHNLVVTNTFFKLPKRRLYTWKSPADKDNKIVRNQIDYILINHRYRNAIQSVRAYPGADVSSDHNPLIAKFQLHLKKVQTSHKSDKLNIQKLKSEEVKEKLRQQINAKLESTPKSNDGNVEQQWQFFRNSIIEPSSRELTTTKYKKEEWMTDEILELMEERRRHKNVNKTQYQQLHNQIRRKIRKAKETFFTEKCEEIEDLQNKYDNFNLHKKVKELAGLAKRKTSSILLDKEGNAIIETEQKLRRWKEYIEELFHDQRQENVYAASQSRDEGPEITKSEVMTAVKCMKNNKAAGPDGIPGELLKLINEKNMDVLTQLLNTIYTTGIIPREMLTSTFICLPKKVNAKECSDYRTISLMSHTLKTLLKIIHNRIRAKLEMDISDSQFGFRNGMGTREALFSFNVLIQRCLDVNRDLYVCFIDYNKAFDKVKHDRLVELLRKKNLDIRDVTLISNLYHDQRSNVKIGNEISEEMEIKRGVRQGCILSPLLFNAYSEEIIQEALVNETVGIRVNGVLINNIRYADDTVIIADKLDDLQRVMNRILRHSGEYGLSLNIRKTKFMKISKNNNTNEILMVGGQQIERVKKYTYLGTIITENNDYTTEIRVRIEKARANFVKMKKILCSKDLTLALRLRLTKCYVRSVLYYGVESWTLKQEAINRLNAFEMWTYRRMLKSSWVDRVTNTEVLRRVGREREVEDTIKGRKLQYFGHVMRGERYSILRLIIQGKIEGKRSIGRRRVSWLRNLREWFGCSSGELFRAAASKVRIAMMIANLRRGDGT